MAARRSGRVSTSRTSSSRRAKAWCRRRSTGARSACPPRKPLAPNNSGTEPELFRAASPIYAGIAAGVKHERRGLAIGVALDDADYDDVIAAVVAMAAMAFQARRRPVDHRRVGAPALDPVA